MSSEFPARLALSAAAAEAMLDRLLSVDPPAGEGLRPARLLEAMRHAALGGGKRLRPFLVIETARLFGAAGDGVVRAAAALECVHCYSLVHDDLPAMDDDDLRRGKPTVHRAFDEATAILAGDALLTLAFDVLAEPATDADGAVRLELIAGLARAAGIGGMVGGQMLDIAGEGDVLAAAEIEAIQAMKTGSLFGYACEAGAILGRAHRAERQRLARFGSALGSAFQLADDLLDLTGDPAMLGKRAAKDSARQKPTLVALRGEAAARDILAARIASAVAEIGPFGDRAAVLVEAARFIGERRA